MTSRIMKCTPSSFRCASKTKDSIRHGLNNILFPRNRTFCGRKEILENMYGFLGPWSGGKYSRLQTCVLYGSRGVGKTQIAMEYCYRHRFDYDGIFWIEASTEVDLTESYRSILKLIKPYHDITDIEMAIQIVKKWLASTGKTAKSFILSSAQSLTDRKKISRKTMATHLQRCHGCRWLHAILSSEQTGLCDCCRAKS